MSSIDQRVVQMKFDNNQFEQGIKTTLSSLDSLSKGLKLEGATKGLNDVSAASKSFSLSHISDAVDSIANKFSAVGVIAITALSNITNRAISAGTQLIKSLTVDPISSGLHEYETNLNSIQTILANTGLEGQGGLNKVNAALQELNTYSDKTIYNFSEMARNIGTFTAAGVKLDVATSAIKGIANLAAVSGSNAQQASTAMYQLSQSLAAGKVSLEDWNSVVNAGMGGKVFQDALMETARVHGVAIDKMVKDAGSFRLTLQDGWLTGQILTETLSKFTGDLSAAQLKTMGYNDQQIAGILKMGATAQDAATKVKTFSQLLSTLQEAAGSGWTQTWQLIFGDFEQARTLFTNVNNVLGGFISASSDARNKVLGDWNALGGRTVLIEAISNAFHALIAVIKPIKDAFSSIFPATTGKQLYDLTVAIRDFTAGLKIGGDTADKLKRTFAGVFAVLSIGWDIIKAVAKTLFGLVGIATEGSGGFLEFTARIGDFLVGIREGIRQGDGIVKVFQKIGVVLAVPIKLLQMLGSYLGSLFDGFDGDKAAKSVTGLVSKLDPLGRVGEFIANVWGMVTSKLDDVWKAFLPLADKMGKFFSDLGSTISSAMKGIDFGNVLSAINTGLFAGLVLMIHQLIKKIKGGIEGGGFFDSIKGSIDQLTSTMQAMQNTLRAATLLEIAAAIGLLTISVVALSKIDSEGLTRALTAMTVMFTQLFASMAIFEKTSGASSFAKMPLVAISMILLAIAVDILASAVKKLADLDWNGLAKGLTGLTGILAALVATVQFMPDDKKLISTGAALVILALAVKLLVGSVTDLSGLSWEDMAKGLTGVGALLTALTLFTKFSEADKGGLAQGAGLLLLAVGVKILASAMSDFTGFSWEEIARGLVAMAGSLAVVTAALMLIPPTAPLAAAGVLIVAVSLGMVADVLAKMGAMSWGDIGKGLTSLLGALTIIAAALIVIPPTAALGAAGVLIVAMSLAQIGDFLQQMSTLSWEEIGKAMVALTGSLLIIAVAVTAMTGALTGAAALLVVAASLAVIAPILQMFGQMSWEEMGKGLLMLAGVFLVLGVAGLVLTPVVPTLLGLGIAVLLLGVGMLAAGVGVLAFSVGLTALSIAGAAGAAAMVAIVSALIGLIPMVMEQIGLGVIAFAQVIATAGPAITMAIVTVINSLIDAIIMLTPKVVLTLAALIVLLLNVMANYVPQMVDAGLRLLTGILNGIARNIDRVVTAATDVIVNFINAISNNQGRVIQAGVDMIISYVNGLANAIRNNSSRMADAGANLASAIIEGMGKGLSAGIGVIADKAREVARAALNAAKDLLGIKSPSKEFFKLGQYSDEGMANGMDAFSGVVSKSAEGVGQGAIDSLRNSLSGISELVSGEMDTNPTITPVLDLNPVRDAAVRIAKMLNAQISVGAAYSTAKSASADYQGNQAMLAEEKAASNSDKLTFNQFNNSPKALSSAEIYRQTKNQLSVAKGALAK